MDPTLIQAMDHILRCFVANNVASADLRFPISFFNKVTFMINEMNPTIVQVIQCSGGCVFSVVDILTTEENP